MDERILEIIIEVTGESSLTDALNTDLFETGLLDSLGVVNLIVELEEEYDIIISPSELEREEFNTPSKIIEVVKAKAK
ncbi:MAG: D-alanine--poly(phosphoribitol) ligase subunit DltC [Tissierellia bacterium]|nr:D-alanine--poly(phosphoribitol) ligase subunit DltC [Tissierellia bacterium]